jgi:hypothetical protein
MGWMMEFAIETVADLFSYSVGRKRRWWVQVVAYFGCLTILGVPVLILWVLTR